jgi:hypothetical protein
MPASSHVAPAVVTWSVVPHRNLLLASDRNYGLYILQSRGGRPQSYSTVARTPRQREGARYPLTRAPGAAAEPGTARVEQTTGAGWTSHGGSGLP